MNIIFDPKIFNYIIIILYLANAIRWWKAGSIADMCYWLSALSITLSVTFLYKH